MSERVKFSDGIIFQKADRDGLSVDTLREDLISLLKIQDELQKQKAPLLMLYDASYALSADSETRRQAVFNMNQLNYERVAVFGFRSFFMKQMARLVIAGMGKQKKIKLFDSKEHARLWLEEKALHWLREKVNS